MIALGSKLEAPVWHEFKFYRQGWKFLARVAKMAVYGLDVYAHLVRDFGIAEVVQGHFHSFVLVVGENWVVETT